MKTREHILQILLDNQNQPISGQELANRCDCSRTAIWKHIHSLQEAGYSIESVPGLGYILKQTNDILEKSILQSKTQAPAIYVFDTIDSTNTYAKQLLMEHCPEGTLVVSNHQTSGRGRAGHSFYSPADTGVYFSIVLRPNLQFQSMLKVTLAAAVSVCEAIETLTNVSPSIKWVNDIFIDHKKIAGILTEATTDFETQTVDTVVVGIGINCHPTSFPKEIQDIAGSIDADGLERNQLVSHIYQRMMYWKDHLDSNALMEAYRSRSIVIGKEIEYTVNTQKKVGRVLSIDDHGNLILEDTNKNTTTIVSGEISIRNWD